MQKKFLFVSVFLLFFLALTIGCRKTRITYSAVLQEEALVVNLVYTPSRHGGGIGPTFNVDIDGNPGFGIASVNVDVKEAYAVVFQCQHGKFIIGNERRVKAKKLWNCLKEGENVTVTYREVYRDILEDGKLISRNLIKYDFIDAK